MQNSIMLLVIGTSNKTEIMLGYFTKYGDGAVDMKLLEAFIRQKFFEIAKFLKLPEKIINKIPTAELYNGQADEAELGASYAILTKFWRELKTKKISTIYIKNMETNRKKILDYD